MTNKPEAYPGFEVEVEVLNADPTPILIGHSAGGVFVQILLDHGYGAVGVAINSAPTEGVAVYVRRPQPARSVPKQTPLAERQCLT